MSHQPVDSLGRLFEAATHNGGLSALLAAEQVATLMFLALLDAQEAEREAEPTAIAGSTLLFPQQSARYRWSHWRLLRGDRLLDFVRGDVVPYMASLATEAPRVAEYFRDFSLRVEDPSDFEILVDEIESLRVGTRTVAERTDIFNALLQNVEPDPDVLRAPADVYKLMAELAAPSPGARILDPACGTGELLLCALEHATASVAERSKRWAIDGMDIDSALAHIAAVRFALAGIDDAHIRCVDALSRDGGLFMDGRTYDVVLCEPPFGLRYASSLRGDTGELRTSSGDLLFLSLMLRALAPGGLCVVLVPERVLFQGSRAHLSIRRKLIDEFEILAVASLPGGALSGSAVKSSVLVVRRPTDSAARVRRTWLYDLAPRDDGGDWRDSIALLLAQWRDYRVSGFHKIPGTDASAVVVAGSEMPASFWIDHEATRADDDRLDIASHRPYMQEQPEHEQPQNLLREALALEEQITDKLRMLLALSSDSE